MLCSWFVRKPLCASTVIPPSTRRLGALFVLFLGWRDLVVAGREVFRVNMDYGLARLPCVGCVLLPMVTAAAQLHQFQEDKAVLWHC